MKSAFEKIKERLEEKRFNADLECASWTNKSGTLFRCADSSRTAYIEAIEIVNKVEEEGGNDGWIPCSSGEMPKDEEDVLVWFEYFRYGDYNRLCQRKGIGFTYEGEWSRIVNGQSGWSKLRIIAWQPLPPDYQPKGE